jgi:rubrerythrin
MFGLEKAIAENTPAMSEREQLISDIRANDAALDDLSTREYNFRQENFATMDGRLVIKAATPEARPEIERRWRELSENSTRRAHAWPRTNCKRRKSFDAVRPRRRVNAMAKTTVRQHLKAMHERIANQNLTMGKCFSSMAQKCMGKADAGGGPYEDLAGYFTELASQCCDENLWHLTQSKELDDVNYGAGPTGKADGGDMNKIAPDGVRGVISDVPAEGFGLTAVPRFGSRPMMGIDTSGIPAGFPAGFQKLVEISEE